MHFVKTMDSSETLPVPKIICMGSNYRDHIQEMKGSFDKPDTEMPVLFLKPPSSIIHHGGTVIKPRYAEEMHHEVECVIVIGKKGRRISPDNAADYILGFTVGLDMTLRDLQKKAKQRGEPWAIAKGFDTSAAVGDVILRDDIPDPQNLELNLWVDGALKQKGNTGDMITGIYDIVAKVSEYFTLERGDLIFTGTPSGVGPVGHGSRILASLDRYVSIEVGIEYER